MMAVWGTITCFMLCTAAAAYAPYTDDLDYNNFEFYKDLSINYPHNSEDEPSRTTQDDFYILSGFEDAGIQSEQYLDGNDIPFNRRDKSLQKATPYMVKPNWYQLPERIYRYTKHRIPGYDYDELDYVGVKNYQECDSKSVWTHCLCQFTCSEPDVVDCYTPCKSGCECKEDYVFDEKTQQCLSPEQCPANIQKEDNIVYNE